MKYKNLILSLAIGVLIGHHLAAQNCRGLDVHVLSVDNSICYPQFLSNGFITAAPETIDGSSNPQNFSYQWYQGLGLSNPMAGKTSQYLHDVPAGTYTVRVTDPSTNCFVVGSGTVNFSPLFPQIEEVIVQNNNENGFIKLKVSTSWPYQMPKITWNYLNQDPTNLTNVWPGWYVANVEYPFTGCGSSVHVIVSDSEISRTDTIRFSVRQPTDCTPVNGYASMQAKNNGTQNFNFDWWNFDSQENLMNANSYFDDLQPGNYQMAATDAEVGNTIALSFSINEPYRPETKRYKKDNFYCDPAKEGGSAEATVYDLNLTPNTRLKWFRGLSINPIDEITEGITGIEEGTWWGNASNLPNGNYTVYGIFTNGCEQAPAAFTINDSQASTISTSLNPTPQTYCLPNGAIAAEVNSRGDEGQIFRLFSGNNKDNPIAAGTDPGFSQLMAGTYSVETIDTETACSSFETVVVPDNIVFPDPQIEIHHNTFCVEADGSLTVTGINEGLLTDHLFNWFTGATPDPDNQLNSASNNVVTGLSPGLYTLSTYNLITLCFSNETVEVLNQSIQPVAEVVVQANTNCSGFNGAVEVSSIAPGTADDYEYWWSSGNDVLNLESNASIGDLGPGTYSLQVENPQTGCVQTQSIEVADASTQPIINHVEVTEGECDVNEGILEVTELSEGSLADYSFTWYSGNSVNPNNLITGSDKLINQLSPGDYSVTATNNSSQCTSAPQVLSIGCITGIADGDIISLFPNPSTSTVYVKTNKVETTTLTLLDSRGVTISSRKFIGETSLEVSNLSKGVYSLLISGSNGTTLKRFIVQ